MSTRKFVSIVNCFKFLYVECGNSLQLIILYPFKYKMQFLVNLYQLVIFEFKFKVQRQNQLLDFKHENCHFVENDDILF